MPDDVNVGDTPKKFIRTYASDAEAVGKGQLPGLAVAPEAPPVAVAPSVLTPAPAPVPIQNRPIIEAPVARSEFIPSDMHPAERLVESTLISELPVPPPPPPPPPPLPKPEALSPIHTYTSDFASEVKKTNATDATILAAEQDRGTPAPVPSPQKRSNVFLFAGGGALVIIALAGIYYAYISASPAAPVPAAPVVATPIFVNEREELSGSGQDLVSAIAASVAKPLASDGVRFLYTADATTTGNDLFSALNVGAPGILLRNIVSAGSMAGVIREGGAQSPFFILSVSSYDATFAGMFSWESRVQSDLSELFPMKTAPSAPITSTTTVTTIVKGKKVVKVATTTMPAPVYVPLFKDEVVANHDVRELFDSTGATVLLYGYWDPSTLIIAANETDYAEIVNRLATSRTQKQ